MSEIVKRLEARAMGDGSGNHATRPYTVFDANLDRAAAAEITRLNTALENARKDAWLECREEAAKEIECGCKNKWAVLKAKTKVERWNACQNSPCAMEQAMEIRSLTPPTEKAT